MAHLYKQTYTREDPKTGERIKRSVKKWYGKFQDADGIIRKIPLCEDKQAAQAMLTDIARQVELEKAGIVDTASKHLSTPIEQHIQDFRNHLEAKIRSESHISETVRLINNIVNECRLQILADLQSADDRIEHYLTERRLNGVSHRTVNADLAAIRAFCRWLIQRDRIQRDPAAALGCLNVAEDRRLVRRSLSPEESAGLVSKTMKSDRIFRRLDGRDRAMLYLLAQRTGLRRKELCSLTPSSFDFSEETTTVTVKPADSKHRKADRLPLPNDVAEAFQEYLLGKNQSQRVWGSSWWRHAATMLRDDLADAGVSLADEDERVIDFHSLRTTFITSLSRAGLSPALAQKLARHSDINLTMATYTQLEMKELGGAVNSLPAISPTSQESKEMISMDEIDRDRKELLDLWEKLPQMVRTEILSLARTSLKRE